MDRDKAIRAAKLTAKQVSSHKAADRVADLLRQGRAKEVTNDLIDQADPQRLHHHYVSGNTGVDMPMDQASRMERAAQMGFDTQKPIYHGSLHPFSSFKIDGPNKTDHGWYGKGSYFGDPETGSIYATNHPAIHNPQGGSVIPAFSRGKTYTWPEGRKIAMDDKEAQDITKSMMDQGYSSADIHAPNDPDVWGDAAGSWRERVVYDPTAIRSQFARFDPRLSHLSHLSASTGGAMELARHATAVGRAGGQVSPSKYLPDVPRAVHADGGKVAFQQGNHPDVPDVVYHGTNRDIQSFDPNAERNYDIDPRNPASTDTGWFGKGHYFAPKPKRASYYAEEAARRSQGQGAQVYPVHLSMKNPFVVHMKDTDSGATTLDKALSNAGVPMHSRGYRMPSEQTAALIDMGHDGVIAKREGKTEEIVAFHPNQIKSAIGNQGTFDPKDPDITKADGGPAMFQGIHPDLQGESGAPLDLYHGTAHPEEFEAFDDAKLGARDVGFFGRGHYLTPARDNAQLYAGPTEDDGTVIGPLHAALKNPYVWDVSDDMKSSKTLRDLQSMGIMRDKNELRSWDNLQQHHVRPFMAEMQKRGHDGVIVKTGHEHLPNGIAEVVAFDPKTIKHKDAEVFDPTDPRIRREDGGEVEKKRDFMRDNPGGEWLENKRARAAQYPGDKFMIGATTGVIGGRSSVFLPTHVLKGIAGLNDEVRTAGVSKYDSLLSDAQKGGFDPEQKGNKVVVAVNHFGQPYLLEGNTRVAVAHSMGIPKVRAEVRYWNGAENVDGPMHPEKVFGMASDIDKADGGEVDGGFEVGKKYNGVIPQIKYLPVHAIERQPSQYEVSRVSDDVAKNMDFSEPVEATAFRYGSNNSEDHPSVALQNGHHRLAAAHQTGRPHLPVTITAVNAKGEKLNALKALSDEIERTMVTKADGGRVSYGNGGKSLGLYSKAAQIIRNQPQAKGSIDQLLAMVSKTKGVKPAELTNAGRPAGGTMSKEELAKHFEDALPKVDVERIGGRDSNGFPQYEQYTLPGGENYREHLLHLSDEREPPKALHRVMGAFPRDFDSEEGARQYIRQLDTLRNTPGMEGIAESLTRYPAIYQRENGRSTNPNDFKSSHWGTPNVLAHVRMSDRDNGETLHVHEVQSDWGQEGRENGFYDPEKPFEVVNKKTKEVVSRHPDYSSMWDAYRTHPDSDNLTYGDVRDEKPPQGPYVGNTQQWTDLALKHIMMEAAKGGYKRVVFSPGEANADLYGQRKEVSKLEFLKSNDSGEAGILSGFTPNGYYSSQHDVESHADLPKLIGKENAANLLAQPPTPSPDKGEDRYTHTLQGPLLVGGHGMVDYYKNYVNQGAMKLLQQHDQSAKPESYDLPEGYKGFALPVTDTSRESILKNGFQAFQRGGEVHKASGGQVMGYVPMATLPVSRLAVARAPVQQQQAPVGRFSDSLSSLMDTVEGFKKKPEAEAKETPSGTIAMPESGYEATGMYAPFQSAIDQMIADAPGKITVTSGYRTPEEQEALWNEHAAKYPDPEVRDDYVARAGQSSHNYGLAADLSYADEEALKWAQENAAKYGLNFRMGHEDWHIEPLNIWELRNAMTVLGYASGGRIGKDDGGAMFGHHNTSDKGVEVASNIGGIPMPSMAISKVAHPLESFGDVTLMAHPSMVTPSKDTNVWSADTYTGRQPRGEEEFSDPKSVRNAMRLDPDFGHMQDASNWIDSTNGVTDADEMMKTAQLGIARGVDPKEHTSFRDYVREVQKKLGSNVYDNDHMPGLRVYGDIKRVLYPKDMYTPSGKRKKPVDYTLDAVMRYMKGASEAGSENWNYGAGNFRAVNTPKFLSMSDVKADRGLIIPKNEMKPIKSEFEKSYNGLVEELVKARGQKGFRAYDEAAEALTDISKGRKVDWFGAVPPELVAQIKELGKHASKMPTEYFEAKSKKAIPLSAFPAALVSRDNPETARRLTEAGVKKVLTYGSPEERVAMYSSNPDLMFNHGGVVDAALALTRGFTKDGKSAINSLKPKGK
jgi:LAS superfamily LD-carboxypeptidase LdcB